ncbi:MAG: hypothetical protein ACFFCE_02910 [Promethearchaeota archaeon]
MNKQKEYSEGVTIVHNDQCLYITDLIEKTMETDKKGKFKAIKINERKEA